jgi:thymidylate kinase
MEGIMFSIFGTSPTAPRKPSLLYFEGNVGSGKSEAVVEMKMLLKKKGFKVYAFTQNIERWMHDQLLQDMYANPEDRAARRAFQTLGPLKDYIEQIDFIHKFGSDFDYILIERHPTTTIDVFSADQAVKGLYDTVNNLYPSLLTLPDRTVYVTTTPQKCLDRVKNRKRQCEREIKIEDIVLLDQKHNAAMQARNQSGRLLITVDATRISAAQVALEAYTTLKL